MERMRKDELSSAFWRIVQIEELLSDRHRLWSRQIGETTVDVVFTRSGLWIVLDWGDQASVAFRAAFSPGALTVKTCCVEGESLLIDADTRIGRQVCEIRISPTDDVLTFRTVVLPHSYLTFEAWSRDIVPLQFGAQPDDLQSASQLHSTADDHRTGQVHASIRGRGTFLYVQELPSLAALCGATRATLADAVGGEWPEIGFVPPRGRKALSPCDGPTVLSHAHVAWTDGPPPDASEIGEQQLALLAAIYLESGRVHGRRDVHAPDAWSEGSAERPHS